MDTLVLGCTHYPLLTEVIGNCMGPGVTLGERRGEVRLPCGGAAGQDGRPGGTGQARGKPLLCQRQRGGFSRLASIFLRQDVAAEVTQVDIWRY